MTADRKHLRHVGVMSALMCLALGAVASPADALPSYHSPGYKGTRKAPRRTAPPPAVIGQNGQKPSVLVDAAGTAHVVWNEPHDDGPDLLRYCRVPRGARSCTASAALFPQGAGTDGLNDDDALTHPLSIGNQLLLMTTRFPHVVTDPDGGTSDTNDYLFVSNDGGKTFPGDPGVFAVTPMDGGATVYGGTEHPSVGVLGIYRSGGPFFQGAEAGRFVRERANLGDVISGFPLGPGSLATDGTVPIAAVAGNDKTTWIRRWTGTGDINDSATWSASKSIGVAPTLASGPRGVFLLNQSDYHQQFGVRPVVGGNATGAAVPVVPKDADLSGARTVSLSEDAGGHLTVGWVDHGATGAKVQVRHSIDGTHWDPAATLATPSASSDNLDTASTADGGGFAVFTHYPNGPAHTGQIELAAFGSPQPTGRDGLGALDNAEAGGPGDTSATLSCREVQFGAVHALAQEGCFLRDPKNPNSSAGVTAGAIRLNGLDIVPDAGVKIVVDPRRHTLNTTGSVHVYLRAPVAGQVEVWHGELHIELPAAGEGKTLFDFDTSDFAAVLKGFPLNGHIQVILEHDAVRIPVSVTLPKALGGISGDAVLRADNAHGLVVDSLHIHADDFFLGPVEIKPMDITYTAAGDIWDGSVTAYLPTGGLTKLSGRVRFEGGRFKLAAFTLGLYPGIPLYADVYFHEVRLGLAVDPLVISGGVSVGFQPIAPPSTYLIDVAGDVKMSFSPFRIEIVGRGSVVDIQLVRVGFVFNTDPLYARADLDISLGTSAENCGVFDPLGFEIKGSMYAGEGHVGGIMEGGICFFGATPHVTGGISDEGIAVCASRTSGPGISHEWGDSPFDLDYSASSCYVSQWAEVGTPAAARAHAAQALTFTVPAHSRGENLRITGTNSAPGVTLISPSGKRLTPAPMTDRTATVVGGVEPAFKRTAIGLRHPEAGRWTVETNAGSSPIARLEQSHARAAPAVKVRVRGRGRHRRLTYRINRAGVTATFAERIRAGEHKIGTTSRRRGTIKFSPGDGQRGRRAILATISEGGAPREHRRVGSYIAPGPRRPGRVRGISAHRRGRTLAVRFRGSHDSARYVVRVKLPRHRVLLLTTTKPRKPLRFVGVRPSEKATITVRGLTRTGRLGPAARKRVPARH